MEDLVIPTKGELTPCHACRAPILWTTTDKGRRLAVDPRPRSDGNMACWRGGPRWWRSRSLQATGALAVAAWEHVYMPHPATCPGRPPVPAPTPMPARAEQPELPGLPQAAPPGNVIVLSARRRRRRRT